MLGVRRVELLECFVALVAARQGFMSTSLARLHHRRRGSFGKVAKFNLSPSVQKLLLEQGSGRLTYETEVAASTKNSQLVNERLLLLGDNTRTAQIGIKYKIRRKASRNHELVLVT